MTNLEKMIELVNQKATKEEVKTWAYLNRISVCVLFYEEEFSIMENSVNVFLNSNFYDVCNDELDNWDKFLDSNFID